MSLNSRTTLALVPLILAVAAASRPFAPEDPAAAASAAHAVTAPAASAPTPAPAALDVVLAEEAFGRSGAMRTAVARAGDLVTIPTTWNTPRPPRVEYRWLPVMGTAGDVVSGVVTTRDAVRAPAVPGIYELELTDGTAVRSFEDAFRLVVTVPFEQKKDGRIGRYFMGNWPTEGSGRTDRYAPPPGFIRVTPENQGLRLSEHFSLKEFLTHDQGSVWPKYVVVDPRLLDKLELVMDDLNDHGVRADHMIVMSGFRTPQYNRQGLTRGRASLSRHQYGDAADVWVDNNGDWYMDDLNGDGRRDTGDSRVMLAAVARVEARHPDLVGGAGIYPDNGAHGPFIHIDVRGSRARW